MVSQFAVQAYSQWISHGLQAANTLWGTGWGVKNRFQAHQGPTATLGITKVTLGQTA